MSTNVSDGMGSKGMMSRPHSEKKSLLSRRNPFKLPADNIFQIRKQEEEQRRLKRSQEQTLKLHEKWTFSGRMKARHQSFRQREAACSSQDPEALLSDPKWRKESQGHTDKTSTRKYVEDSREIFRLEYSIAVKNETILSLVEAAATEDKRLTQAEEYLKEYAAMLDEFKENDRNLHAEEEAKAKLENMAEIKRITSEILAVESDIAKNEEIFEEYSVYQSFLLKLSPPEWQEKQRIRKETAEAIKAAAQEKDLSTHTTTEQAMAFQLAKRQGAVSKEPLATREHKFTPRQNVTLKENKLMKMLKQGVEEVGSLEDYEDPQIYFTESQQLLELLKELENQNLSIIQNLANMEKTLDEFQITSDKTLKKMEQEIDQLVNVITHTIQREKDTAAELQLKSRLFCFGEYKAPDQELMLDALGKKVAKVNRSCLGVNQGGQSTGQMLEAIDWRVNGLLDCIKTVPRDKLLTVEREQRRIRQREEKMQLQKMAHEERLSRILYSAQAGVKKITGQRLKPRSQPLLKGTKESKKELNVDPELEKNLYF